MNNTYDFGFTAIGGCESNKTISPAETESPVKISNAYPNPFRSSVSLQVDSKEPVMARISLYAPNGSLIQNFSRPLFAGTNMVRLDNLDKLPAGVYSITLQYGDQLLRSRIVKQ